MLQHEDVEVQKNILKVAIAGVVMIASAGIAMAAPATATANINVRSGPGGGYGVIDTLRRGDRVDVQDCQRGWCYVEKRGPDGWVSSDYLATRRVNGGGYNGGGYNASPGYSFEFNFGNVPQRPHYPRPNHGEWDYSGGGNHGGHHNGGWDDDRGGRGDHRGDWNGPGRPRDWN